MMSKHAAQCGYKPGGLDKIKARNLKIIHRIRQEIKPMSAEQNNLYFLSNGRLREGAGGAIAAKVPSWMPLL